jgi:acetolactate synthase-1/2/3 large subunit
MPGMHGTVPAVTALQKADLLITLGARFDDRVTGDAKSFAPNAKVIHVDIDPAEIGKIRFADVPIVGDAKDVIIELIAEISAGKNIPDMTEWWQFVNGLVERYPLGYTHVEDGKLSPQYVIKRIGEISGPEAVYAAGVGQHQMWSAQFIKYERPNAWLNSGGAGTMGYSVPAAMGAKVGQPDRLVWAIDGDGCFQMTNQELATCAINDIPIKVAIINNSSLGMVRQWQTLFYNERYSNTDLNTGTDTVMIPDFVKLAEAYGCLGIRVEKEEEIDAAIKLAIETNDRPVVIDFIVSRDAMVWPMVSAGVSNDEVKYARDAAPVWDGEE